MAKDELKRFLPRGLILDLEDRMAAATVKAFQIVRDHAGLDKKRGRELEGQARFRIMEHAFEEVCELYGGQQLGGGHPHGRCAVTTRSAQNSKGRGARRLPGQRPGLDR